MKFRHLLYGLILALAGAVPTLAQGIPYRTSPAHLWATAIPVSIGVNVLDHMLFKTADTPLQHKLAPLPNTAAAVLHFAAGLNNMSVANNLRAGFREWANSALVNRRPATRG